MAMSKEQAEVVADALSAPALQERARLDRIREANKRRANRPWPHFFSGACFFVGALLFTLVASRTGSHSGYWFAAGGFLLASIAQFAAFFIKRKA
jgi:hypothetical protein